MSPVCSSSTPGLDVEDEAEHELLEAMSSNSLSRDESDQFDEVDELAGDTDPPLSITEANEDTNCCVLSPAAICHELVAAWCKSDSLKLHPYQCTAIKDFVKVFFIFPFWY